MAGVKGRSGKPKDKPWADALRLAVMADGPDGFRKLRAIAERCAEAAMGGDMTAIKEIGDRLDGKPALSIDHTGELDVFHNAISAEPLSETEWEQQYGPPH